MNSGFVWHLKQQADFEKLENLPVVWLNNQTVLQRHLLLFKSFPYCFTLDQWRREPIGTCTDLTDQ